MISSPTTQESGQASLPATVSFVAVNQPESPYHSRRRRAQVSCERCRKRKSRCDVSETQQNTCVRCLREGKSCEFRAVKYRRRGVQPLSPVQAVFNAACSTASAMDRSPDSCSFQAAPDAQAIGEEPGPEQLLQLSLHNVPGEKPDELQSQNEETETRQGHHADVSHLEDTGANQGTASDGITRLDPKLRIAASQLHNPADALDLLTFAASEERYFAHLSTQEQGGSVPDSTRGHLPQQDDLRWDSAIESDLRWNQFFLVQRRLIKVHEIIEFIMFFFTRLWPLKPIIPEYYNHPSRYILLAIDEPVLLRAVITLASRYHALSGDHGEIRSERIHWQVWSSLQVCLQSAIWGSTRTRSLGTIAALLLLIDWHAKAINNPSTFTPEDDSWEYEIPSSTTENDTPAGITNLSSKQRHSMASSLERLEITSSAYRSNKMSWMLLANAIALAQEGCCFEVEPLGALNRVEDDKITQRDWARVLCVFIYLVDEHLALRLDLESLLPDKARRAVVDSFSKTFACGLPAKEHWDSYFELTEEMRKAREYLHGLKHTASAPEGYDLVPVLKHTYKRLESWQRQFTSCDQASLLSACLSIEFRYAVIYSVSPVGFVSANESNENWVSDAQCLRCVAVQAARDMLSLVVNVLEPSKVLRYIPVRCWLFILTASLYLLKEAILHRQSVTDQDPDIQILLQTVTALRRGAPDDVHTAGRYSQLIGIIVDAVLRPSTDATLTGPVPEVADTSDLVYLNSLFDFPFNDVMWWDNT